MARRRSAPREGLEEDGGVKKPWSKAAATALASLTLGCGAAALPPSEPMVGQVAFARGSDGAQLDFESVAEMASQADVVVMGEVHGHERGLDAAARLFAESVQVESAALSLEFFERDQQSALDQYLSGKLDSASFLKASRRSASNYPPGHRRMVELARDHRRAVYAANAPRRYAKLARTEGFDALRALPPEEHGLFAIPEQMPGGAYRDAFTALMGGDAHGDPHGDPHGGAMDVEGYFRAQALWDETMAQSIAGALADGHRPVFHVVGRFHVDHDGGLLQQLRTARPDAAVLSVSTVDRWYGPFDDDDRDRADVLVFVGPGEG